MSFPSWPPAMFATHLPYWIAAIALVFFVRRTRKSIERMVERLEQLDRRES